MRRVLAAACLAAASALSPPAAAVAVLRALPRSHPMAFGCGLTCAKTVAADLLVQRSVEKTPWRRLDARRLVVFGFYGLAYRPARRRQAPVRGDRAR